MSKMLQFCRQGQPTQGSQPTAGRLVGDSRLARRKRIGSPVVNRPPGGWSAIADWRTGRRIGGSSAEYRTSRPAVDCLPFIFIAFLLLCTTLTATEHVERIRELYIPDEYLSELFAENTGQVMLSREEYESLLLEARQIRLAAEAEARNAQKPAPVDFVWTGGHYRITVGGERALIEGELELELLRDGLTAIPLQTKSVAIRGATVNNQPARIGSELKGDVNNITVFVQGKGRHTLRLQLTTALTVDSTQQELMFSVPRLPQMKLSLDVPGDVSMKSGAAVLARTVEGEGDRKSVV